MHFEALPTSSMSGATVQDLCVKVVAANFEACPTFGPLPDKYVKRVVDILPIDLPLELAGTVGVQHASSMLSHCAYEVLALTSHAHHG